MRVLIRTTYSSRNPYLYARVNDDLLKKEIEEAKDINISQVRSAAFKYCSKLTTVSFPSCSIISNQAFAYCSKLTSVYLLASSVCALNTSVFDYTPIVDSTYTGSFGSIFVPASLLSQYKSATNWATYSNRITAFTG